MSNEKILNPETNRWVLASSKIGRKIKAMEELHAIVDDAKPNNAEPINAEPVITESINAEPINAEPINAEPINAEPINAEPINDVIEVVNVDDKDVVKFETNDNIDVFKIIDDKRTYMKKYYKTNRDKIIEQSKARYKLKTIKTSNDDKKTPIDKKTYMQNYYKQNKEKIKERSQDRYKIKKEINVITNNINERLE
jgi:hypothetical protein